MSTVTLSNPHCAITSAEKPEGIASQAFTTALPEAHIFLTLFTTFFPSVCPFTPSLRGAKRRSNPICYCGDGLLRFARNDRKITRQPAGCSPRSRRRRERYSLSPP